MNVHAIVGHGEASPKAITESLRDVVKQDDAVGLIWNGKPTPTEEAIYDFLLDNDVTFVLYYSDGDKIPGVFRDAETGVMQKSRFPEQAVVEAVEGKGKVLFRWDDNEGDEQIEGLFDVLNEGTLVLELTNGLAPIRRVSEGEIPEPQDREVEKDEADEQPDDTEFTKDELQAMTPISVKRYGERKGTTSKTKKGIIAELFPESPNGDTEPESPSGDTEGVKTDGGPVSTPTGTSETVTKDEVPQLLRIIAGNLIRLANALS